MARGEGGRRKGEILSRGERRKVLQRKEGKGREGTVYYLNEDD